MADEHDGPLVVKNDVTNAWQLSLRLPALKRTLAAPNARVIVAVLPSPTNPEGEVAYFGFLYDNAARSVRRMSGAHARWIGWDKVGHRHGISEQVRAVTDPEALAELEVLRERVVRAGGWMD